MNTTEINPTPTIGQISVQSLDLIKHLEKTQPGQIVTYSEMADAAKIDVQKNPYILNTARRNLQKSQHMAFGTVRGIGIKRLENDEIPDEATGAIKRARRIAKKGMGTLSCADMSKLSPEAKVRAVTTSTILGFMTGAGSRKVANLAEQSARASDSLQIGDVTSLFSKA
jgi:hypothetical protein